MEICPGFFRDLVFGTADHSAKRFFFSDPGPCGDFCIVNRIDNGFAPIHWTVLDRNIPQLKSLLADGAIDKWILGPSGCNVFHCAAMSTTADSKFCALKGASKVEALVIETLETLLKHATPDEDDHSKLRPDFPDAYGSTPLHYAAQSNNLPAAKVLIDWFLRHNKLMALSITNADGATPLHLAALEGSVLVTQLLLGHHVNVDALTRYGETPLYLAVNSFFEEENEGRSLEYLKVIELLVCAGADINKQVPLISLPSKPGEFFSPLELAKNATDKQWKSSLASYLESNSWPCDEKYFLKC